MAAQFESLQPSFNQMDQLIQGIAKQHDDVADATWALDEEMVNKFKQKLVLQPMYYVIDKLVFSLLRYMNAWAFLNLKV